MLWHKIKLVTMGDNLWNLITMGDNSQNISLVQNSVFYTGHTHITINSKKKLHQNKLSEKF
jgi:hypothetical protein